MAACTHLVTHARLTGGGARLPRGKTALPPSERERVDAILHVLATLYPDAGCALIYSSPFELLVATILSAQSTDRRVNQVTHRLFSRFRSPQAFASLCVSQLEQEIRELGLFRSKARHIIAASRAIVADHDGQVPADRALLEALPGVGRKTAGVVLSNAFGIPALAVDTHVFRVARRLGLAAGQTPEHTEKTLTQLIPREKWSRAHHWLIHHGRQTCTARRPACSRCALLTYCPTGRQEAAPRTGREPEN